MPQVPGKIKCPAYNYASLSQDYLQSEGYLVQTYRINQVIRKRDKDKFMAYFNVLAIKDKKTLVANACFLMDIYSRARIIRESNVLDRILMAGWYVEMHGWSIIEGKWRMHIIDIS